MWWRCAQHVRKKICVLKFNTEHCSWPNTVKAALCLYFDWPINISPVSSATLKSFLFVSLHFFVSLWVSLLSLASRNENVNDSGNSSCCAGMHLQKRWSWLSYWHSSVYLTCQCFGQFFCYTGLFYLSWQWSARFGTWSSIDISPSLWANRLVFLFSL